MVQRILGEPLGSLGVSWEITGTCRSLGTVKIPGRFLEARWALLGRVLGALGGVPGRSLGSLGGGSLGALGRSWDVLGRSGGVPGGRCFCH